MQYRSGTIDDCFFSYQSLQSKKKIVLKYNIRFFLNICYKFLSKSLNIFVLSYKYTKIKNGTSGGRLLTYFKCAEPGCRESCSTDRLIMTAPTYPITFFKVTIIIIHCHGQCFRSALFSMRIRIMISDYI